MCKNYQFILPFTIFAVFVWFYAKYFILPPCTVDVIMFGDVSEEGVMIHEVAVVTNEGGVLIVDVTVHAWKNKMIIFLTINVNFISYSNNLCKNYQFFYPLLYLQFCLILCKILFFTSMYCWCGHVWGCFWRRCDDTWGCSCSYLSRCANSRCHCRHWKE